MDGEIRYLNLAESDKDISLAWLPCMRAQWLFLCGVVAGRRTTVVVSEDPPGEKQMRVIKHLITISHRACRLNSE
jgi:hypothetical protein